MKTTKARRPKTKRESKHVITRSVRSKRDKGRAKTTSGAMMTSADETAELDRWISELEADLQMRAPLKRTKVVKEKVRQVPEPLEKVGADDHELEIWYSEGATNGSADVADDELEWVIED